MYKKRIIVVWLISILINITFYGNVYSDTKVTSTANSLRNPNIIDHILYKEVLLRGIDHRTVLVNRITGEVQFILTNNKKWILLSGAWKKQCQARYDAQVDSKQ